MTDNVINLDNIRAKAKAAQAAALKDAQKLESDADDLLQYLDDKGCTTEQALNISLHVAWEMVGAFLVEELEVFQLTAAGWSLNDAKFELITTLLQSLRDSALQGDMK